MGNEVFAFCLTLGAGLATTIGASLAMVINHENNRLFAACLSLAAGVMTYVSFVEIFFKSRDEYEAHGWSEADANTAASLTFFFGIGASILLETVTNMLFKRGKIKSARCPIESASSPGPVGVNPQQDTNVDEVTLQNVEGTPADEAKEAAQEPQQVKKNEQGDMLQMAAFSGVAIAAHNFPEGVATFVAAMEDPAFGATMAIAIAIHNIPEGLAVAIPILKATNSRRRAFFWAFLSGVAEPVGGVLSWLVLRNFIGPLVFAMLFGVIGGVMVHISIRKLIPTAFRYDPEDTVSSYSFFAGMAVMAASLVIFGY